MRTVGARARALAAVCGLLVAAVGGAANQAQAAPLPPSYVYKIFTVYHFDASDGAPNYVTVNKRQGTIEFVDTEAPVRLSQTQPSGGCVQVDEHTVRCPHDAPSQYDVISVSLADGDDNFANNSGVKTYANGGDGNDTLTGIGRSDDTFSGDSGNDALQGSFGNDTLYGGSGNDTMTGGSDNDRLVGDFGKNTMWGGPGNDVFETGLGADDLDGGTGLDRVDFDDRLNTGVTVSLDGSANDGTPGEHVNVRNTIEEIHGTPFDDKLSGDAVATTFYGHAGRDTINGGGGDDLLYGGADRDIMRADDGNDVMYGEDGNDDLDGGRGDDHLDAGLGRVQTVIGGDGFDTCVGHDLIRPRNDCER